MEIKKRRIMKILTRIFFKLWEKNKNYKSCPLVKIPTTVVYENDFPVAVFKTSKKSGELQCIKKGSEMETLKIKKMLLKNVLTKREKKKRRNEKKSTILNNIRALPEIKSHLSKVKKLHKNDKSLHTPLVMEKSKEIFKLPRKKMILTPKEINTNTMKESLKHSKYSGRVLGYYIRFRRCDIAEVTYINSQNVENFLFHHLKGNGVLQKFIHPKGTCNSMYKCFWTRNLFKIEKMENINCINDASMNISKRLVTFEGLYHHTKEMKISPFLIKKVKKICLSIADHIMKVMKKEISRMNLYFKVDENDEIFFLYCDRCLFKDDIERNKMKIKALNKPVSYKLVKALTVFKYDGKTGNRDVSKGNGKEGSFKCVICKENKNKKRKCTITKSFLRKNIDGFKVLKDKNAKRKRALNRLKKNNFFSTNSLKSLLSEGKEMRKKWNLEYVDHFNSNSDVTKYGTFDLLKLSNQKELLDVLMEKKYLLSSYFFENLEVNVVFTLPNSKVMPNDLKDEFVKKIKLKRMFIGIAHDKVDNKFTITRYLGAQIITKQLTLLIQQLNALENGGDKDGKETMLNSFKTRQKRRKKKRKRKRKKRGILDRYNEGKCCVCENCFLSVTIRKKKVKVKSLNNETNFFGFISKLNTKKKEDENSKFKLKPRPKTSDPRTMTPNYKSSGHFRKARCAWKLTFEESKMNLFSMKGIKKSKK